MLKKLEKLHPDCDKKLVTPEQCSKIEDSLTKKKIENYLAYRNADDKDKPALGVLIKDRHNFYTQTLDEDVKKVVVELLRNKELDDADKVKEICKALEYECELSDITNEKTNPLKIFDLLIDYGKFTSVVIDDSNNINHNIIEYLNVMFDESTLFEDVPDFKTADFLYYGEYKLL